MAMEKPDPIRPTDDEARTLARQLIEDARFGALAVTDAESGGPSVTRVAIGTDQGGTPVTLISSLSAHWQALAASPRCALLLGEPGPKGDPLVHPRLTVHCTAAFVDRDSAEHAELRAHYLESHPKSKLYIDFGDFAFVRFTAVDARLNGGFGKAFRLTADDLSGVPTSV